MNKAIPNLFFVVVFLIGLFKSSSTFAQTGEAINFDGVNDVINFTNAPALQLNNGTVEAWIKIPISGAGFSHRSVVVKQWAYGLFLLNNRLAAYDWVTTGTFTAGIALNDNNWHHVAFSFQNGVTNGSRLYIDGVATGPAFTYNIHNQGTIPAVGGNPWSGQYLNGTIDEVRIWNTLRTPCEISAYMGYEIPNSAPGLVANYHFNQGIAAGPNSTVTSLTDFSGNGFTGALSGLTLTGSTSNWVAGGVITSTILPSVSVPTLSILGPTVICSGSSTNLTASGANTYTWTLGPSTSTLAVSPSVSTTYSVVGTASNGCVSNITTHTINVNQSPTVAINNYSICGNGPVGVLSATVSGTGPYTYTWSNSATTSTISGLTSGVYSLSVMSANGCFEVKNATVNIYPNPTLSVNNGTICSGSNFTINPTGALTYTYSGGAAIVSPTTTSTYTITGTNSFGCNATSVINISVNGLPIVTAVSSNSAYICIGQSTSLTGSGANTYSWNTGVTASVIVVTPTVSTTYTLTGTDAYGCSANAIISQSVSSCTGINASLSNPSTSLMIYPNPSNGELFISSEQPISLKLINEAGMIVKTINLNKDNNRTVKIDALVPGIYILISNENNYKQKIIVSN